MSDVARPTPSESLPARPAPTAPRRPWVAGLLTLLAPGLGHVYAGRPGRGLAIYVALLVWSAGLLFAGMLLPSRVFRIATLILLAVGVLYVIWDATDVAAQAPSGYKLLPYNRWYVYLGIVLLAFVLQSVYRSIVTRTIAEAFRIPSGNMSPTVLTGDFIMVAPRLGRAVERGQMVVVRRPQERRFLERVLGMPGDTLAMKSKVLYVNGQPQNEGYVRHIDPIIDPGSKEMLWQRDHLVDSGEAEGYRPSRDNWGPLVVPPEHYFLLGDNRDNSYDSRFWGMVTERNITERPIWIYFSRDPLTGQVRWSRVGSGIH